MRITVCFAAALVTPLLTAPALADPVTPADGVSRVRPHDARSASLLSQGLQRSRTMRAIVGELQQRDVIVYIQMQPSLRGRLLGKLTWVTGTRRFRYLRIFLNPAESQDVIIATLGHELQHAVEVAHEPSIVSDETLEAHYRTHGIRMTAHDNGWDTELARITGDTVRREIRKKDWGLGIGD
jgi:hypothetical protein